MTGTGDRSQSDRAADHPRGKVSQAAQTQQRNPTQVKCKSAKRVLEVFEFFAEKRRSATVGEISQALGYPQSSTSVLLQSLHQLRYLDYKPVSRTYQPTLRFALTGSWIHDAQFTGAGLTAIMVDIQREVEAEVVLGIRAGIDVQYIQRVPSTLPIRFDMPLGVLRPMARTAVGKVLLSLMDDDEASAILRHINSKVPDEKRIVVQEILEQLEIIRETGIAYSENEATAGAAVIAIALPGQPQHLPMALGIGAPTRFIREKRDSIEWILHNLFKNGRGQNAEFLVSDPYMSSLKLPS